MVLSIPLALALGCVPDCIEGYEENSLGVCSPKPPGADADTGLTEEEEEGGGGGGESGGGGGDDDCGGEVSGTVGGQGVSIEQLAWTDQGIGTSVVGFKSGDACGLAADLEQYDGLTLMMNFETQGEGLSEGQTYDVFQPAEGNPPTEAVVMVVVVDGEDFHEAATGAVTVASVESGGTLEVVDVELGFDDGDALSGGFGACYCDGIPAGGEGGEGG